MNRQTSMADDTDNALNFPPMVAMETSAAEEKGFPTAIAWTLDTALYKAVLIQPDENWLNDMPDDTTPLERPVSELLEMGENPVDIVKELTGDRDGGLLYAEEPDLIIPMMERLFAAVERENPYDVQPMQYLFAEFDLEEVERTRRLYMDRLDLVPQIAEQNILLWRATYAHLQESL